MSAITNPFDMSALGRFPRPDCLASCLGCSDIGQDEVGIRYLQTAVAAGEIDTMIREAFPDARGIWRTTETTMRPASSPPAFKGKSRVRRHQTVYEAL
jgi:hypothetical protein